MGDPDDERVWIEQSRNGDQAAFEALIGRHQRMIHALTYRMTGSLADAEDLAQEAFIRAYQQLTSYEGKAKFSSWLYRIALNACLNWRQRELRRHKVHSNWAETADLQPADPGSTSDGNELRGQVQECLMKLPAKQRAAIVLTVYDGLNHAEAARLLGCSETTVSWRIFAARNKLKRWLKPAARGSPGR
jgi:RNA polymerase sigma-70 factor, ECF subfamily